MFTGIIEAIGEILAIEDNGGMITATVGIKNRSEYHAQLGDSIAVNGCCLTVSDIPANLTYRFDISKETLSKTNLAALSVNQYVNLERAARLGSHMGGHLVSGHVDGIAEVMSVSHDSDGWQVCVRVPSAFSRYLIDKGSICLDGVSLTINTLTDDKDGSLVGLTLIPTTVQETTFSQLSPGNKLNLEVDLLGKYLERLVKYSK